MNLKLEGMVDVTASLIGFGEVEVRPKRTIFLIISMGLKHHRVTKRLPFVVVDVPFDNDLVMERLGLNLFKVMVSTFHLRIKFPRLMGIGQLVGKQ